ncbi:hypothetical protein Ddye_017973 [Dipteronia dyeriana]|uniref:D-isomer specific 2-hydroxyacid dehydrogenase NAD-binding domain-containing protein n=1 Tax=Dipteronia dyeriana TaxID=168575 RepID=A0AAD9UA88_9ROSI|nr:hypothetical protein Ddye_017973 [Dipteronia dyeriana]
MDFSLDANLSIVLQILVIRLIDQTHRKIDNEVLSGWGKVGVIVNIGRGANIDEQELVRCLVHEEIKGDDLDVFGKEPNEPKELLELEYLVLLRDLDMGNFQ